MKEDLSNCCKPRVRRRRGQPLCWTFPFCNHQWKGVLDMHAILLAQIFHKHRPNVGRA